MPYGVFPVPKGRDSGNSRTTGPSLAVRIRTRFGRAELDSELARGADRADSAELALRAEQLTSPAERARIANALVESLGDARRGEPMTLRLRPQREVVRDATDDILALVLRLRDDRPVGIPGVAAAARLVDDRRSPMYRDDAGDLHDAIRLAQVAIEEGGNRPPSSRRELPDRRLAPAQEGPAVPETRRAGPCRAETSVTQ